jgi:hypothetical protein
VRVTEVVHFLTEDSFANVPDYILKPKQKKGNAGHKRLEIFIKLPAK